MRDDKIVEQDPRAVADDNHCTAKASRQSFSELKAVDIEGNLIELCTKAESFFSIGTRLMLSRYREMKAEVALSRIGTILFYEHEWDVARNRSSGRPAPGPRVARWLLGEMFFAKPMGCILYDYKSSIDYLRWLTFLPSLQEVAIIQSEVDDTVCDFLSELRNLKTVSLHGTQITDAGLAKLEVLDGLQCVIIGDTKVTEDGRNALRSRLPNCEIVDSVPVLLPAA